MENLIFHKALKMNLLPQFLYIVFISKFMLVSFEDTNFDEQMNQRLTRSQGYAKAECQYANTEVN